MAAGASHKAPCHRKGGNTNRWRGLGKGSKRNQALFQARSGKRSVKCCDLLSEEGDKHGGHSHRTCKGSHAMGGCSTMLPWLTAFFRAVPQTFSCDVVCETLAVSQAQVLCWEQCSYCVTGTAAYVPFTHLIIKALAEDVTLSLRRDAFGCGC